jgi:hypothetical protein
MKLVPATVQKELKDKILKDKSKTKFYNLLEDP